MCAQETGYVGAINGEGERDGRVRGSGPRLIGLKEKEDGF